MTSEAFFEHITNQLVSESPFVAYRKPNEQEVKALLQKNCNVYTTSEFTESGFVFAPFNDKEKTILIPLEQSEFVRSTYNISEENLKETTPNDSSSDEKQKHITLVQKGIEAIHKSNLQKVVLSRCESISSKQHSIAIFKKLLNTYHTAFVYCWYHPKIGLWLGATPETLLKTEGNRFSTMALAGTQNYSGTLNVNWQSKEQDEQQYVTDFIVKNLKASVDSINQSKPATIKAGNLLHLQTKITGLFNKQSSFKSVLKTLHPTPAVCGLPKNDAKQFILQNETYNREFYTGFLGELNLKEKSTRNTNKRNVENNAYATVKTVSNLYVNLRCMQLNNSAAIIYVGGGITKDSNSEAEWQETVYKSLIMKKVLQ